MKPILYDSKEKLFDTKGIGALSDCTRVTVAEQLNGMYEMEMDYPVKGIHFLSLVPSNIIMTTHDDSKEAQPFRIYRVSKPLNGIVTVYAEHSSYQLRHIVVNPFEATGAGNALAGLVAHSVTECDFETWTDLTNAESVYRQPVPRSFRKCLGGVQGSILDTFGGEFEFDFRTVKLHAHRGRNNGVRISYGKNLLDLRQEENIANVITGIVPFYRNDEGVLVTISEGFLECENADRYPYKRTIEYDFTSEFDAVPTEDELRAKAQSYVNANLTGVPDVSLKVSFLALWQTAEYKNIASLERVQLGDTVTVVFPALDVHATAKVIKVVWDALAERYTSIEIGTFRSSLSDSLAVLTDKIENSEENTKSMLESALEAQKNVLTGSTGGYVHTLLNSSGQPSEHRYTDTDSLGSAYYNVRIGSHGLGFYHGDELVSAWSIDGTFSADNINAGTLSAERIAASSIQVYQLEQSLQNLAQSVTVGTDGVHVAKFGEGAAVESVMEADGLHLYYSTGTQRDQIAYFTTYEAMIKNARIENYLYTGGIRIEGARIERASDHSVDECTAFFGGSK